MEGFARPVAGEHKEVVRKFTNFKPCVWGDYFITLSPLASTSCKESEDWMKNRVEVLIEEVKVMLRDAISPLAKMHVIDALQRLGVDYHFEQEIGQELHQIYTKPVESDDLHTVSLQFRLLRQNRYHVSSDVFKMFKDEQGNFMATLANDLKGLLSLYDAAYLGTPQDQVLDEAIEFGKSQLKAILAADLDLDPIFARRISHALKTPMHRRMRRLEARLYMSIYEEDRENHNNSILELAKLDFHLLQLIHREEIRIISKWWKELGLSTKLSFARDRIVECYFWILGVYFEPQYSKARLMMTKVIAFLSLTDDIFDNYGTIRELQQYNEVIQRHSVQVEPSGWDLEAIHQLDENFQLHFLALTKTLKEFELDLSTEQMSYRIHCLKLMLQEAIGAWFEEAKYKDEGCLISFDEYVRVSLKTTAYQVLACASFVGMGEIATNNVFDWIVNFPKIIRASTAICRFMDDAGDFELDTGENHIVTAVNCYAKDYGTSAEIACQKLLDMVEEAWKIINQEVITLTLPTPLAMRILNLARMMETMYRNNDGYTESIALKDYISLLLVEPIPF